MSRAKVKSWWDRWRERGATALIAVVVSAIVSAGISSIFTARLENSKVHASIIMSQKAEFDASQNNIFGQLALYSDKLLRHDSDAKKDDLQKAIVSAQLQLARLRSELPQRDQEVVSQYSAELENFLNGLRGVSDAKDLKPVYISAQKLLVLNDRLADTVRANVTINP